MARSCRAATSFCTMCPLTLRTTMTLRTFSPQRVQWSRADVAREQGQRGRQYRGLRIHEPPYFTDHQRLYGHNAFAGPVVQG